MHMTTRGAPLVICCLIATRLTATCAPAPGNFCDVMSAPVVFAPETVTRVVASDRGTAERPDAQNIYGTRHCRWGQE